MFRLPLHKTLSVLVCMLMLFFYGANVFAYNWASTTIKVLVSCGNGLREGVERCDQNDFELNDSGLPKTCADFEGPNGQPYQEGDLKCSNTCDAIYTDFCSTCGNGAKEGYEQCDASDFGQYPVGTSTDGSTIYHSVDCAYYGYNSGVLSCNSNCNVNVTACSSVGLTEPGDSGNQGGGSGGGGGGGGGQSGGIGGGNPGGGNTGANNGNYNPGSDTAPKDTVVVIMGKAYPNSQIDITRDGDYRNGDAVVADTNADFRYETNKIPPGVVTLGLRARDSKGRKSLMQTFTFRVSSGAVTTITGAFLAPSIDIDKPILERGQILKVAGQTVPKSSVSVSFHSNTEIIRKTSSDHQGEWLLNFDTTPLEGDADHIVKAMFELQGSSSLTIKSGYSDAILFRVGKSISNTGSCPGADLNRDKKVNLIDFSILLFYWGTNNSCADQNHNNKVDLIDFSIMLYNWTG